MSHYSMTGFGKGEAIGDNYTLTVEIKTVNNRYKDYRFKMGSVFNSIEMNLKKELEKKFKRGSFEIFINYKKNEKADKSFNDIDWNKVESYIKQVKEVANKVQVNVDISPVEFLRNDFYVQDESKEDELIKLLDPAFTQSVLNLAESRSDEGEKLINKLKEHRDQYVQHYEAVKSTKDSYQDTVRDKLKKKFEDDGKSLGIDEPRFLQEVIYYLEKLDIDEEINRIHIHLEKLDKLLNHKGEVGRQLEFLLQELNRESNTIGSKSGSSSISENVVQMKVQLEKIREQALNLE